MFLCLQQALVCRACFGKLPPQLNFARWAVRRNYVEFNASPDEFELVTNLITGARGLWKITQFS